MSRPRFLADHDLNEHIIDGVLQAEPAVEFIRARQACMETRSDDEVLAFAAGQGLIVVSHDVNTMTGAAWQRVESALPMAGLLMVHQLDPVRPIIESLILIWSASEAEEYLNTVRFLPL